MGRDESWESALTARLRGATRAGDQGEPPGHSPGESPRESPREPPSALPMPGGGTPVLRSSGRWPGTGPAGAASSRTPGGPAPTALVGGPGAAGSEAIGSEAAGLAEVYARLSRRPGVSAARRAQRRVAGLWRSDDSPTVLARCGTVIQRPVATGRRVVVLGVCGGAGSSTIALALAAVLASVRGDGAVVLAAAGDATGVAARVAPAAVRTDPAWAVEAPETGSDGLAADVPVLVVPVPDAQVTPGERGQADTPGEPGVRGEPGAWGEPGARGEPGEPVLRALQRLTRYRPYVIADLGTRWRPGSVAAELTQALVEAHAIVVVVPPLVTAVAAAQATIGELTRWGLAAQARLVVSDPGRPTGLSARAASQALAPLGVPVEVVPLDRHLAGGAHLDLALVAEPTLVALARVTAGVVHTAGGGAADGRPGEGVR